MIKKILTFLSLILYSFTVTATETKIDIQYDGIYLDHISLAQLEKVYQDYEYRDYLYMPGWKYPPIFMMSFPTDFNTITDSQKRNKLFLQMLIPLTLKLNREIMFERWDIEKIAKDYKENKKLTDEQIKTLEEKAEKYDIFTRLKDEQRYEYILTELNDKVDIIPPSLLIASAAIETNWGTNRPAQLANSLYRELVWHTEEGLEPKDETEDKSYRYKIFPSLYDSMVSKALKINSSINYQMFRFGRAQIKYREVPILGRNLAHNFIQDSNLQNYAGLLDYTMTFYELSNIDEAELLPLQLPKKIK